MLVLGFLAVLVFTTAQAHEVCFTFGGQQGSCMSLAECMRLRGLHQGPSLPPSITRPGMFKPCNTVGFTLRICCPPYFSTLPNPSSGEDEPKLFNITLFPILTFPHLMVMPTPAPTTTPPTVSSSPAVIHPDIHEDPPKVTRVVIPPGTSILIPTPIPLTHPKLKLLPLDTCGVSSTEFIWKGKFANRGQFPWVAQICYITNQDNEKMCLCGGSLINSRYVLTAAHCVIPSNYMNVTSVKLGEHDVRTDPDCDAPDQCSPPVLEVPVEKVISHPKYGKPHNLNDIALIRLTRDVDLNQEYIKAICLPVGNLQFKNPEIIPKMAVAGWGRTENGSEHGSPVLKFAGLPSMTYSRCNLAYITRRTIQPSQICFGGETEDSCSGDSGGPLFVPDVLPNSDNTRFVQYGLVSFGPRLCGSPGRPGIYTRVGYFLDWILENIQP